MGANMGAIPMPALNAAKVQSHALECRRLRRIKMLLDESLGNFTGGRETTATQLSLQENGPTQTGG